MLGSKAEAGAAQGPNDDRRLDPASRHETMLGDAIGDLVEADAKKVGEHDLDDRPIASQSEAKRRAYKSCLRDWRVAHARRAELLV